MMKQRWFFPALLLTLCLFCLFPVSSRGTENGAAKTKVALIHSSNVAGHLVPCPT